MVSFWTEPFLNFWIFMKKYPCKKNKIRKNCFDKQEKFWTYLKMFRKKRKDFKANWVVLAHSKPKFFSAGKPWWSTFIWDYAPSSITRSVSQHRFSCSIQSLILNFQELIVGMSWSRATRRFLSF